MQKFPTSLERRTKRNLPAKTGGQGNLPLEERELPTLSRRGLYTRDILGLVGFLSSSSGWLQKLCAAGASNFSLPH